MIEQQDEILIENSWNIAMRSVNYRTKFIIVSLVFIVVLLYYPYFFAFIQKRHGVFLNDPILNLLPSIDVSPYIFLLIYFTVALGIYRTARSPIRFLTFLCGCLFFSLSRIITMYLVPLEPPAGLMPLTDPILKTFYGTNIITKDLFYSGHTGSVFLIYLVLQKKWEKVVALIATISVAILLLIQHIHYTVDVIFAPVFVYVVFLLAKKIATPSTVLNENNLIRARYETISKIRN